MQPALAVLALLVTEAAGHGWVTEPVSKNHMASRHYQPGMPSRFRYEPQSSAGSGPCGSSGRDGYTEGLDRWEKYYDQAGVPVPELVPGSDFKLKFRLTADHNGQAWMMVACGSQISESTNWTFLERSSFDRQVGFLPSNPTIYAWSRPAGGQNWYHVPSWFSCPTYKAVGRWLWKTGNSCNDFNNRGKKTETFSREEYLAAGGSRLGACGGAPETFISCFDFRVTGPSSPTPAPAPTPAPQPTPAPTTPTPQPTPAPTPAPPSGPCRHQTDCSVSVWCNSSGYEQWCQQQGAAGQCPSPYCTTVESLAAAAKASSFLLRR